MYFPLRSFASMPGSITWSKFDISSSHLGSHSGQINSLAATNSFIFLSLPFYPNILPLRSPFHGLVENAATVVARPSESHFYAHLLLVRQFVDPPLWNGDRSLALTARHFPASVRVGASC